jgi:hypothetical protein
MVELLAMEMPAMQNDLGTVVPKSKRGRKLGGHNKPGHRAGRPRKPPEEFPASVWDHGKAEISVLEKHFTEALAKNREIARFLAAQDAINISGGATKGVCLVYSVGEQTAISGKDRKVIDRRYVVPGRRQYDRRAMHADEWVRRNDKAASRLAPKGRDGRFDFYVAMNGRNDSHDLE